VVWSVHSLDGSVLASGHTSGGGIEGPEPFSFSVPFDVPNPELGRLEVFEQDMSDGEGFPPSRNVIPIVLMPSDRPSS
jgi:hypothetical protein